MLPNRTTLGLAVAAVASAAALSTPPAYAVNPSTLEVKNAAELVKLCTTPPNDPNYAEAIHFCHGYLVGAYHYYESLAEQPMYQALFCPDNPKPTRDIVVNGFVEWSKAHPQYNKDKAVTVFFKYLIDKWPCDRQVP